MLDANSLARLQAEQYRHDQRNHSDIICMPKVDRLKHYGLHYAKYVGRLYRSAETIPKPRTVTDTALVCLSAANTLHQKLDSQVFTRLDDGTRDNAPALADAAGRFADACEKIDHLESFLEQAKSANIDVMQWVLDAAAALQLDLDAAIRARRLELAERQFFIWD